MFTIGLFDKSIRLLDTNKDGQIRYAKIISEGFEFENIFRQNKLSESAIEAAAEKINDTIKESGMTAGISRLVIDTDKCFANVIPLDYSEPKDKISSNILWELSNYFPDDYKEFKINYHKLLSEQVSENIYETLIIGIKNSVIDSLKKLARLTDTKIISIDIEHFTSEKYFRQIRKKLFNDECILVIGCKKNRFDFSVINDSGCFGYNFFICKDANFQERLAKEFTQLESKYTSMQINNIYLYGDETTTNAYQLINGLSKKARVILSNPFYEIGITDKLSTEIVSEGYKFIPLCGLSLEEK